MGRDIARNRRAVNCINLYLSELTDPKFFTDKRQRMQASYARSTMLYLRKQINEDPSRSPREIILLFISSMDRKTGFRYSVAYDTAVDFFDRYYAW